MKSNEFGRFKQQIIIRVDEDYAIEAEKRLGRPSFRQLASGGHDFKWERLSSNVGDDEGVVFDLSGILDLKKFTIVWDECEY